MYEILKNLAVANGWPFIYARTDFGNLFNGEEQINVLHLFLDPVKRRTIFNDSGAPESKNYSGNFMLVYSSDLDMNYQDRFDQHIKPILDAEEVKIENLLTCNNKITVNALGSTEVINVFDYNFDGLIFNFDVTIDL